MPEFRVYDEKYGIRVVMVVVVDSNVKIEFLITNNANQSGFVDVKYYDTLGNSKTFRFGTIRGEINKSTGVVYSFPIPNNRFDACVEILGFTGCTNEPVPEITDVWQSIPSGYNWFGDKIFSDVLVWSNGEQKAVPVFPVKQGLYHFIGWTRRKCYVFPISKVRIFVPCYAPLSQRSRICIDTSTSKTGVDNYSDVWVTPEGGYYIVTDRVYRDYYEDFYFYYDRTVTVQTKFTHRVLLSTDPPLTIPVSGKLLAFTAPPLHSGAILELLLNDNVIFTARGYIGSSYYQILKIQINPGDKLSVRYSGPLSVEWISNICVLDYSFNNYFDEIILKVWYNYAKRHEVRLKAIAVPEEIVDEYIEWLRSRGFNAVKINPSSTARC